MNRDPNVITLLDRFTVTTEDGDPDVYSPWRRVPSWCKEFDLVYECLALQSLNIDISIEGSIDKTSAESQVMGTIADVGMTTVLVSGLGRYARVALKAHGAGEKPNMVLSASLIPKGIARH